VPWLPLSGTLLFYYDYVTQDAWGFDPKDQSSFAVRYSRDRSPSMLIADQNLIGDLIAATSVKTVPLRSLPSWEREAVRNIELDDNEFDEFVKILEDSYRGFPKHQLFGFPVNVQGDGMELECQLVSNRIYCGDPSGYNCPEAKALAKGKDDWRLLLQLDSDDESNIMFGDSGRIYFWIREQDALNLEFEKAWMILQCY
jgi:uncharacterized protein YwqG